MRFFLILCFLTGIALKNYSQSLPDLPEGYYVIVGAFAIKDNAEKFNASLNKKGVGSSFGYLPSRNIYYVYTLKNPGVSDCIQKAKELRKQPEFSDAWVRYINENSPLTASTEQRIELTEVKKEPEAKAPEIKQEPVEEVVEAPAEEEKIVQYDKVTLGNTEIFLSLYNSRNDKVAEGNIQVIDADRARVITEAKGNTYLNLPDPKNTTGNMLLICDVVGYRKIQKEINYNNPTADSTFIQQMGTTLIANFELIRYQKGDIRTLYNVYFFNDAAVMLPESKFELNSLLDMMQENPNYRIKLHGHANGSYHGKIIRVGPSGDFFSVAKDARTSIGSATELSESRAEVIKDWLVSKGIDGSRIEVKAWGGKRPLYDKHSANAKKNIRVEVEIIGE